MTILNEEKLRLGFSITDIGQMSYHNSPNGAVYTMNVDGHNTSELEKQGSEIVERLFQPAEDAGFDHRDKSAQYVRR